jgi:hypothetical protein
MPVRRGDRLYLQINGRPGDDDNGVMVMAELTQLRPDFPRSASTSPTAEWTPTAARMAQIINTELSRNETGTETARPRPAADGAG